MKHFFIFSFAVVNCFLSNIFSQQVFQAAVVFDISNITGFNNSATYKHLNISVPLPGFMNLSGGG